MNSSNRKIFFRADGDSIIGLGHIVRCIGVIEILKNTFECVFIIKQPADKVKELIAGYCGIKILESSASPAEEVPELINFLGSGNILVIDGYDFDSQYQEKIRSYVEKLVAIDDTASGYFYADVVINHGGSALRHKYKTEKYTKLLLGFPFLLLREPFISAAKKDRTKQKTDTVFICFGGSDPFNITCKVLQACLKCNFIKAIIVITGSVYQDIEELKNIITASPISIKHEQNVTAEKMVELLNISDLAICPSSTVSLEVCCVKAGLLTGIVIDNQAGIHDQLLNNECAVSIGDFNTVTEDNLVEAICKLNDLNTVTTLIDNQFRAIDGLSGQRLLDEFKMMAQC